MTHDPNYNYDEDGDDKAMGAYDDEEEEENDEYSDDDDMSWKVRRAAAKCLESIICTRHELLAEFYRVLSPVLISRFKGKSKKSDVHSFLSRITPTFPIFILLLFFFFVGTI